MYRLNNPPRWLARALAVINGQTQLEIEDRLYPVVEVVQDGWGLQPTITSVQVDGSLAGPTTTIFAANENESLRLKLSANNPGTAAATIQALLRVGAGGSVQEFANSLAAGTTADWRAFAGGRQWIVVPPGCALEVLQAQYTITAGFIRAIEVRCPGGCNLS